MPEFVGFQTMGILVPYGITFDVVDVFGLAFYLLFKSCSTYRDVVDAYFNQSIHDMIEITCFYATVYD